MAQNINASRSSVLFITISAQSLRPLAVARYPTAIARVPRVILLQAPLGRGGPSSAFVSANTLIATHQSRMAKHQSVAMYANA